MAVVIEIMISKEYFEGYQHEICDDNKECSVTKTEVIE